MVGTRIVEEPADELSMALDLLRSNAFNHCFASLLRFSRVLWGVSFLNMIFLRQTDAFVN
jgi:hypothetical protein